MKFGFSVGVINDRFKLTMCKISHLLLTILFVLQGTVNTVGQETVESLLNTRAPNCYDIQANAIRLIPKYLTQGKIDTVIAMIDYWESSCGSTEPGRRLEILLSFVDSTSSIDTIRVQFTQYMQRYHIPQWYNHPHYSHHIRTDVGYDGCILDFDNATDSLASNFLNQELDNKLDSFIVRFFSNSVDGQLHSLAEPRLRETELGQWYLKQINEARNRLGGHWGFNFGSWFPTGSLSKTGPDFILGMRIGLTKRNFVANLDVDVRPFAADADHRVVKNDSVYFSNEFSAVSISADFGYTLINQFHHDLSIVAGGGFEFATILDEELSDSEDNVSKSIFSPLGAVGLTYKWYPRYHVAYLGLDARFTALGYGVVDGNDFTGHAFSLKFIVGLAGGNRESRLQDLGYYNIKPRAR